MIVKSFEELSMNAWPSLQTNLYDGWILRFADGYTKRANSINPLYKSTIPLNEKIDFCERQYSRYHLPTIFKLTAESCPSGIDEKLEQRGYMKMDETSVRILDINAYENNSSSVILVEPRFNSEWIDGFFTCSNLIDKKSQSSARKLLDNVSGELICVSTRIDDEVVGCGFGVIERGYIGVFDIVVGKNQRRNGYGRQMMNAILNAAANKGIHTAYLQVISGNIPAENLYDKIGFSEAYRYWYRKLDKQQ